MTSLNSNISFNSIARMIEIIEKPDHDQVAHNQSDADSSRGALEMIRSDAESDKRRKIRYAVR